MLTYVDPSDGRAFSGETTVEVVRAMHRDAWLDPAGKGDYMREVAERCGQVKPGARVDPRTTARFLASLVAAGFLVAQGGN